MDSKAAASTLAYFTLAVVCSYVDGSVLRRQGRQREMVGPMPGFASHGFDPIIRVPKENYDQRILEIVIGGTILLVVVIAWMTSGSVSVAAASLGNVPPKGRSHRRITITITISTRSDNLRKIVRIGLKPVLVVDKGVRDGNARKTIRQVLCEESGAAVTLADNDDLGRGPFRSQDVDSNP